MSSLTRHTSLKRSGWIGRGKPRKALRARNPKRQAANFVRCYHSVERVEWVKTLPCVAAFSFDPCVGPIENAHIKGDGGSRKGHYTKIVPACEHHHRDDMHRGIKSFARKHGIRLEEAAAHVEYLWLATHPQYRTEAPHA